MADSKVMANTARDRRITEVYTRAVNDLVQSHAQRTSSPLALAVRFGSDESLDVHLLEVVENFPGNDDDLPFTTEYGASERLLILGHLHLTLVNPRQLEHAVAKARARRSSSESKDEAAARATMKQVLKDARVVYEARSPRGLAAVARKAKATLSLR